MAFNKIKTKLGLGGSTKQYVDEDTARTPSEIQDPTSWRDETSASFRDKLARRRYRILSKSVFIVVGAIVLIASIRRWVPELFYSELARSAVLYIGTASALVLLGMKIQRSMLKNMTWLVLDLPDTTEVYLGRYSASIGGEQSAFKPVCGFTVGGLQSRHYTLGEMSDEFARHFSKQSREADDPIRMGLPPGADEKALDTWFGHVIPVVTDGLQPNSTSGTIDVDILPSARGHEETLEDLIERLKTKDRRVSELEDELADIREERNKYRQEAKKTRSEVRTEVKNEYGQLLDKVTVGTRAHQQPAQNGTTSPSASGDDVIDEVIEGMADD